jgi:hypothetical protein
MQCVKKLLVSKKAALSMAKNCSLNTTQIFITSEFIMSDSIWENLCSWNDDQWQLYTDDAEYEAWLDSQEQSYPEPKDCDPNYEDDF